MNSLIVVFALAASCSAQLRYFSNIEEFKDSLQPVQGLYVKPSNDGETGDLYVAASEDDGVQTPWVADTSVKLLPPSQQSSGVTPTPPQPANGREGDVTVASAPKELTGEQPQFIQVPQFFFPQLLAAAASSAAAQKEAKPLSSNAVTSLPSSYMQSWNYGFSQPQYVLVDAEGWAQGLAAGEAKPSGQQIKLIKL